MDDEDFKNEVLLRLRKIELDIAVMQVKSKFTSVMSGSIGTSLIIGVMYLIKTMG